MGASQSISGHVAHRELGMAWRHRLKRVARNDVKGPCGICSKDAELGEVAYHCRCCGFVLHDACYHLPEKIKHFAHSCSGRSLTLTDGHKVPADRRSCNICAAAFADSRGEGAASASFVYGCRQCHGFYAHPRCCGLPQTIHNALHRQHALTLLPPPLPGAGEDSRRRHRSSSRKCLNAAGNCQNAKRLNSGAWSYQCNLCHVELCLKCQLPDGGGPDVRRDGGCGDVLDTMEWVGTRLATMTGTALHALGCACIGNPVASPSPPVAASR